MSTRCNIIIKGEDGHETILYHHHDGYPAGVGHDLKNYLSKLTYWDEWTIANQLVKDNAGLNDREYEITTCIHGDIEYAYVIDCHVKKLTAYGVPLTYGLTKRSDWRKVAIPTFEDEPDNFIPMYENHIWK